LGIIILIIRKIIQTGVMLVGASFSLQMAETNIVLIFKQENLVLMKDFRQFFYV
jgi:hypothetical protein